MTVGRFTNLDNLVSSCKSPYVMVTTASNEPYTNHAEMMDVEPVEDAAWPVSDQDGAVAWMITEQDETGGTITDVGQHQGEQGTRALLRLMAVAARVT
ncbi:hypothetical protein PI124_g21992 [Phytophthora idaei]|nr:hypothetical protein PI125_g23433 [Phytophthora idaei]KAG3127577.1 hypothetical protein PI126_g21792 [Phytophthora idaei]KAG3232932.1 hypothetical protein PI124_g21992 [Phytophthora idaei]